MGGSRPRVVIAGGSLGGLSAALWLRSVGCEVAVYERSRAPLEGRGVGIVLHPATLRYLMERGMVDVGRVGAASRWVRYMGRDGGVVHESQDRYWFTSYTSLYHSLLSCFDRSCYFLGERVEAFDQDEHGVTVYLASGRTDRADLLVCSDGIHSTARRRLLPETALEYAGYIAWRGALEESQLSPGAFALLHDAVTYFLQQPGHILLYPIPFADSAPQSGHRWINWVWYWNVDPELLDELMTDRDGIRQPVSVPPSGVHERHLQALRARATAELPPPLSEVVVRTSRPFIQLIGDLVVPRMAFGRVCLIGDAAFVARPHVAAGTAKAAEDAWKLAQAIDACDGDVVAALRQWEPDQLWLGRQVVERSRAVGHRMQVSGTWPVGAPLPYGLYRDGDSLELVLPEPESAPTRQGDPHERG